MNREQFIQKTSLNGVDIYNQFEELMALYDLVGDKNIVQILSCFYDHNNTTIYNVVSDTNDTATDICDAVSGMSVCGYKSLYSVAARQNNNVISLSLIKDPGVSA